MKAVLKTKPERGISVQEIAVPTLQEDEVLVKVKAAGICGSDVHVYEWTPSYEWMKNLMPLVLGHEYSGEVVEVGSAVRTLKLGDRVVGRPCLECGTCFYCKSSRPAMCQNMGAQVLGLRRHGAFAEYVATPASYCIPLPENLSFEEGALVEPLVVCASGAQRGGIKLGDTVVVLGPGPIGLMTLVFAKQLGASRAILVGTSQDTLRFAMARKLGADHVIEADKEDPVKAVLDLTHGMGAEVVFEATGAPQTIQQGLDMLQKMSTLVALGIHPGPASVDTTGLVRTMKRIVGGYSDGLLWDPVLRWLASRRVDVSCLVTDRISLDDADQAFHKLLRKEAIKTVFVF